MIGSPWPGTLIAGLEPGDVWVLVAAADGIRFMEDKFTKLLTIEMNVALKHATRLHEK